MKKTQKPSVVVPMADAEITNPETHTAPPNIQDLPQDLTQDLPHAVTLPLLGQFIIEASAGTGKTWTLTGILLRLLIEKGVPCDKIIATTFTRAAAAEMRERINARLTTMLKVLNLCDETLKKMALKDNTLQPSEASVNHEHFLVMLKAGAVQRHIDKEVQNDPIHWYLVTWIAGQFFGLKNASDNTSDNTSDNVNDKQSTEQNNPENTPLKTPAKPVDFRIAIVRTRTALIQLDRLFVGTLDSLCQKWLREFSAETGYTPNIEVNTQPESVIMDLVHDQVRAYQAWLASESPELFEVMLDNKLVPTANAYLPAIQKALTFYSTPIDELTVQAIDLSEITQRVQAFIDITTADENAEIVQAFEAYLSKDYRVTQGISGNTKLDTRFDSYPSLYRLLHERGMAGLQAIDEYTAEWLQSIVVCQEGGKGFKKGFDKQRQLFLDNPITQQLIQLYPAKTQLDGYITQINHFFTQYISRYVKTQLPLVLEARSQTTFSLQLARLNQALEGKQGKLLARYIRHQYPIMLVDESQDINTEQAMLLQRIYLAGQGSGFLLLVGDPKQAIYGFRGGDVSNYTAIKRQFPQKPLPLTQNFRSSQALITALNHWFGVPDSDTDNRMENGIEQDNNKLTGQPYSLGEQINYRYIQASRLESDLTKTPLAENNEHDTADVMKGVYLLNVPLTKASQETPSADEQTDNTPAKNLNENLDFATAIAGQILALCDPQQGYRYQHKPLKLDQICVLADTNRQLDKVEKSLAQKDIATIRGGTQSLFAGQMTGDLVALMHAMLYPYDMARLRRLLMTAFFGLDLQAVNSLFNDHENLAHSPQNSTNKAKTSLPFTLTSIQNTLSEASKRWLSQGFLSAVQWLLNQQFDQPDIKTAEVKAPNLAKNPIATANFAPQSMTFWQRLAGMGEGERLLMDLRQLLDLISQKTKGMGEHQLLQWLEQLASEQPLEDWSMQQRLPSEDGVQLMTIHQSKGLEFEIVFVVGLDKKIRTNKDKYPLYLYSLPDTSNSPTDTLQHRRLTPIASKDDIDFASEEMQANFDEKLRLAYVAFTRAKDRLYIVTQESSRNDKHIPLHHWLEGKDFALPERLQEQIASVDINSLTKYLDPMLTLPSLLASLPTTVIPALAEQGDDTAEALELMDYQTWINGITQTQFFGWANTSFTALSRQLNHNKQDVAINEPDFDEMAFDDTNLVDVDVAMLTTATDMDNVDGLSYEGLAFDGFTKVENQANAQNLAPKPLRFTFEKGTNAGTFLHKILENLPVISPVEIPSDVALTEFSTPTTEFHHAKMLENAPLIEFNGVYDEAYFENNSSAENNSSFDNQSYFENEPHFDPDFSNMDYDIEPNDFQHNYPSEQDFFLPDNVWVEASFSPLPPINTGKIEALEKSEIPNTSSTTWHWTDEAVYGSPQFNALLDDDRQLDIGETSQFQSFLKGLSASWQSVIDRAIDNYQISPQYRSQPREDTLQQDNISADYVALVAWLYHVVQTPLLASDIPLNQLTAKQQVHELGFNMSLRRDFSIDMLNQLFAIEGVKMTLYPPTQVSHYWRYLRGEIDLVYQHEGKFFVVDYKSNYLGDSFEAYYQTALEQAMDGHGYWLQAGIYQVALHRYLQLRLPNYDIRTHLGGVEYVFLRGMHPDKPDYGRLLWRPSPDFILALDMLFGRAE